MASKPGDNDYTLSISGPGHNSKRKVPDDVASKVIAFVMGSGTGALEASGRGNNQSTGQSGSGQSGNIQPGGNVTPKQFLALKKPGSNYERVACLAYYLGNYRDMAHFKTRDITKLNTESAHTFTNPAVFVDHATKTYHFLSGA